MDKTIDLKAMVLVMMRIWNNNEFSKVTECCTLFEGMQVKATLVDDLGNEEVVGTMSRVELKTRWNGDEYVGTLFFSVRYTVNGKKCSDLLDEQVCKSLEILDDTPIETLKARLKEILR